MCPNPIDYVMLCALVSFIEMPYLLKFLIEASIEMENDLVHLIRYFI